MYTLLSILILTSWVHSVPIVAYDNFDIEPLKTVNFELYTNDKPNDAFHVLSSNYQESPLIKDTETVVVIHGWFGRSDIEWVLQIKEELLSRGNYNVIAVDWRILAANLYFNACQNVPKVGKYLGEFLSILIQSNTIKSNDIHLVGHSLGAHVAGMAGYTINLIIQQSIARITSLDAAAPEFEPPFDNRPVTKEDAQFVLGIHTTAFLGLKSPFGHADFYPNGGQLQPGCLGVTCSHARSYDLFIESINSHGLVGTKCTSWSTYESGMCNRNQKEEMGLHTSSKATGIYFLKTNSESPFGQTSNLYYNYAISLYLNRM